MFWCIANERYDSDSADVLDEERNAFYAFMDQTYKLFTYLYFFKIFFFKTCSFLKRKIFLKIPVLAKFFRPGHSRKLIHAKINYFFYSHFCIFLQKSYTDKIKSGQCFSKVAK